MSAKAWLLPLILIGALALLMFMRRGSGGGVAPVPPAFDKSVTLNSALQSSNSDGKPVLMMFTADWCPPCQALKRNALTDPRVVEVMTKQTHPVYLDGTKSPPQEAQQYNIEGYPTMIMVKNGKEVDRVVGSRSADDVLKWISSNL